LRYHLWRVEKRERKLFVIAIFEKSKTRKSQNRETRKSPTGKNCARKIRISGKAAIAAPRDFGPRGRVAEFPKIRFFNRHFDNGRKKRFFSSGRKPLQVQTWPFLDWIFGVPSS
jgi:hypothetical protein